MTNPTAPPDRLAAAARLDPATSRQEFRRLLETISRPGRVVPRAPVPPGPVGLPPALLPALALADLETAVAVLADSSGTEDWGRVVSDATGSRTAGALATADLVVALRSPLPSEIEQLRTGDATAPELGARLVVACDGFGHGTAVHLRGPGVAGALILSIGGVGTATLAALARVNASFPAGVDAWFVAPDGALAAIPRSSRIEVGRDTPDERPDAGTGPGTSRGGT